MMGLACRVHHDMKPTASICCVGQLGYESAIPRMDCFKYSFNLVVLSEGASKHSYCKMFIFKKMLGINKEKFNILDYV